MGRVVIVGGSPGLTGAVALAAQAALRAGAGLVTCAVPRTVHDIIEVKCTEAMSVPLPDDAQGQLTAAAHSALQETLANATAIVIGVGIGRSEQTTKFLAQLLENVVVPHAIDADALWHLARLPELRDRGHDLRVLTPHDGEWQRLGACDSARFVAETPGVLVRKGPQSRVLQGTLRYTNGTGNPGLASGGTGDVLAGVLGAFLARAGATPWDATVRAVWVHGRAGDLAAAALGEESLLASDVIDHLPQAIQEVLAPRS